MLVPQWIAWCGGGELSRPFVGMDKAFKVNMFMAITSWNSACLSTYLGYVSCELCTGCNVVCHAPWLVLPESSTDTPYHGHIGQR